MTFARTFERIVWPKIAERVRTNGTLVACDLMTFGNAEVDIVQLARSRGAGFLPSFDDLHDRILDLLISEIDRADRLRGNIEKFATENPSRFWRYVWNFHNKRGTRGRR